MADRALDALSKWRDDLASRLPEADKLAHRIGTSFIYAGFGYLSYLAVLQPGRKVETSQRHARHWKNASFLSFLSVALLLNFRQSQLRQEQQDLELQYIQLLKLRHG